MIKCQLVLILSQCLIWFLDLRDNFPCPWFLGCQITGFWGQSFLEEKIGTVAGLRFPNFPLKANKIELFLLL